jgi:HSP20 family molecular chaperone IbpA
MKAFFKSFISLFQNHKHLVETSNSYRAGSRLYNTGTSLREDDNTFIISIPVPGLSRQDLRVDLNGRLLKISSRGLVKRTSVNYSFVLPDGVDVDSIQAKCRHGLLTVQIQKLKHERKIIKVSAPEGQFGNTIVLKTWWDRLKKKMDLPKYTQNVRLSKLLSS